MTVTQGEIIILNQLIPKSLSTTRWSARADACKALSVSYNTFRKSVEEIAHSKNEKPSVKAEAMGLLGKFNLLETGILTSFWSDVLEKCDKASKTLQTVDIDLSATTAIFESLIGYFKSLRDQFDKYEERGKQLSKIMEYNKDKKRIQKRKLQFGETDENETNFDGKSDMRINAFLAIIDRLDQELKKRLTAYMEIEKKFGFLNKLKIMNDNDIRNDSNNLQAEYSNDLDECFGEECIEFKYFVENIENIVNVRDMLIFIREKHVITMFPNVEIALRIFLTLPITNASGERSFSTLKRTKTYLRNAISQEGLNNLSVLSINHDLTSALDFTDIINSFASKKSRKRI